MKEIFLPVTPFPSQGLKVPGLGNDEGKYTTKAKVMHELRKISDNMDESVKSIQFFSIQWPLN